MASRVNWLLLVCLSLFCIGCKRPVENEYTEDNRLKITFWHAMGGELGSVLKDMIKTYNQSQDQVYVHAEFMGRYDILEQKIIASVMAGKTPDLAQMYESVTMFLTRDQGEESLIDLASQMKDWEGFSDLYEVFRTNSTYGDKVYSLPFNKSFPVIYFNQTMLNLLGRTDVPSTWTGLSELAKEIHEKIVLDKQTQALRLKLATDNENTVARVYGYAFPVDPWIYQIAYLQLGGRRITEADSVVAYDSEEAMQAIDFWLRAIVEGWGYRSEGYSFQNDFGAGKVAFIITSSVSRKFMEPKLRFPFLAAPVPLEEKQKVSVMSGTNVSIFSGLTKERSKAALDFVQWFLHEERNAEWAERTLYVPVRNQALQTERMQSFLARVKGADAAIKQLPYGDMEPRTSTWYRCRMILREYLERIVAAAEKSKTLDEARDHSRRLLLEANGRMNKELSKRR